MTLSISYTTPGRGAWNTVGGTLNLAGTGPGVNYRSTADRTKKVIGQAMYEASRSTKDFAVHINDVAVWQAAKALQKALNAQRIAAPLTVDGQWGPATDAVARMFQQATGIKVDGVVGPQTARTLFLPLLAERCNHLPFLVDLCSATVSLESGWDPGAVGFTTPRDLGISQINTAAHKDITWETAFDPDRAFDKKLSVIFGNFAWFKDRPPMDRIILATAAYNGGAGGATSWDRAGRPMVNAAGETHWAVKYLNAVARNATDPAILQALAPWRTL